MESILLNRWLHIMAVTLWMGGQLFLVLVLLPAIRGVMKPEDMAGIVSRVGKRFSRITWFALFPIILLTGVINAFLRASFKYALRQDSTSEAIYFSWNNRSKRSARFPVGSPCS